MGAGGYFSNWNGVHWWGGPMTWLKSNLHTHSVPIDTLVNEMAVQPGTFLGAARRRAQNAQPAAVDPRPRNCAHTHTLAPFSQLGDL